MEEYLRDHGIEPDSAEGRTYMQLASAAIGSAVGGGAGANTALAGDAFNRQLHPNEIKLITGELAAKYAAEHPGVSERDAETILIKQSLRQVDDTWSDKLGPDDNETKHWLANNTPGWAKQDGYFTATPAERADPTIYGQYYDGEFHTQWNGILSDLASNITGSEDTPAQHGSQVNLSGYKDMANTLRDQGVMESLERKVASGQGLTTDEVHTYAQLATLYPMLRVGALGPYGQLGVAIRDQDGTAAVAAIIGAVPGEGLVANAGKSLDVATDGATLEKVADILAPAKRNTGETVLGHYPEYVTMSDDIGARRYQIPDSVWNSMSEDQRWVANTTFLDRTINRGDAVILATPAQSARPGSYYAREIDYMRQRGYVVSDDGLRLIPPAKGK
jgi:hypothetical protein